MRRNQYFWWQANITHKHGRANTLRVERPKNWTVTHPSKLWSPTYSGKSKQEEQRTGNQQWALDQQCIWSTQNKTSDMVLSCSIRIPMLKAIRAAFFATCPMLTMNPVKKFSQNKRKFKDDTCNSKDREYNQQNNKTTDLTYTLPTPHNPEVEIYAWK